MRCFLLSLLCSCLIAIDLNAVPSMTDTVQVGRAPRLFGVWLPVSNMDQAIRFYHDGAGLPVASRDFYPRTVSFWFEDYLLICYLIDSLPNPHDSREGMIELNFATRSIPDGTDSLIHFGASVDSQVRESGIGGTVQFRDPFGYIGNLMNVQHTPIKEAVTVYNIGVQVPNMTAARQFYATLLGCPVLTDRYYPPTLVLAGPTKQFTFALHDLATAVRSADPPDRSPRLMLEVDSIAPVRDSLTRAGITMLSEFPNAATYGNRLVTRDPAGNLVEIVQAKSSAFDRRPRLRVNLPTPR